MGKKLNWEKKEPSLGRVKRGQKEETEERHWVKDKREITQRHGLKLKKTERKKRDIQQSYRKTENKEWEKDIERNKKRHWTAPPPSKEKTSNRSGWEICTLWGYSLCISISYSSQTDKLVLCSQGQEGHTLPQATTTHTHTLRVIDCIQHSLRHSYADRYKHTVRTDTNTLWHIKRLEHVRCYRPRHKLQVMLNIFIS